MLHISPNLVYLMLTHHRSSTNAVILEHTDEYPEYVDLVDCPAVFSDLAAGAGEWAKVSHLYHGVGEVCLESCRVGAVSIDLSVCGTSSSKELLIRVQ
jgi:hypothetical protein